VKRGKTIADLKSGGATALGDVELKALVVDKTLKVRNTVTGQQFDILYGSNGQRLITSVDGKQAMPGEVLTMMHGGQSGVSATYEIKDGHIVTTLDGSPFEIAVYKSGDKYVAARSNEFGFANYEVEQVK
jgi:hypothetical protein